MVEEWRCLEKLSYRSIRDVYNMQKRAKLICALYAILECLADQMSFLKKQLKSAGIPSNYVTMSTHGFMTWVDSMLSGEEVLKVRLNGTHWDPNYSFAILDRYGKA